MRTTIKIYTHGLILKKKTHKLISVKVLVIGSFVGCGVYRYNTRHLNSILEGMRKYNEKVENSKIIKHNSYMLYWL